MPTLIEWTDETWSPVTGCQEVSPGCARCYAKGIAERFRGVPGHPYENGFDLTLRPERLDRPLQWRDPRMVFVNSMSDLFHEDIPLEFTQRVFAVMQEAERHTFQVLTKRPEHALELAPHLPWPENVWLGVSIENQYWTRRLEPLRAIPAATRFLSCEPLLGPLDLDLDEIDWVIVGGESGPRARPMQPEWACGVRDQCVEAGVPFFFKQWGAFGSDGVRRPKKQQPRLLDGQEWSQMPAGAVLVGA